MPARDVRGCCFDCTQDAQFDFWVSKYAELVKRTAAALKRHSPGTGPNQISAGSCSVPSRVFRPSVCYCDSLAGHMIWTSNDRLWERPKQADGEPLHTGQDNENSLLFASLYYTVISDRPTSFRKFRPIWGHLICGRYRQSSQRVSLKSGRSGLTGRCEAVP